MSASPSGNTATLLALTSAAATLGPLVGSRLELLGSLGESAAAHQDDDADCAMLTA